MQSIPAAAEPQPFRPRAGASVQALYVHLPFCFHKCHYCDFYSIVDRGRRQDAFTDRLIRELRFAAATYRLDPATIYVGGGTPTLLRVDLWRRLLQALRDAGALARPREFTVEANPETVSPEILRVLRDAGVDRLSLGAQSFDPGLLKALERWHEPASVARAVAIARAEGIRNINLDLIFAIPGQTPAQLDADLDAALALAPEHLSCYGLTYEPGTAMTARLARGEVRRADEALERRMYEHILDRLAAAGFEHYEISNFARRPASAPAGTPGFRSLHNLVYWTSGNWLGLGPSAASHVDGWRWRNAPSLERYLGLERGGAPSPGGQDHGGFPVVDVEHLEPARRVGEQLMLRLRLCEGVPLAWLQENLPADDARRAAIAEFAALGLLESTATHLRLTRPGLLVADSVVARML